MKTSSVLPQYQFPWLWSYGVLGALMLIMVYIMVAVSQPEKWALLAGLVVISGVLIYLAAQILKSEDRYQKLHRCYNQELDFSRQIMDSVSHGLTITDEHGKFVHVNKAYAEMLGVPAEQLLGQNPMCFTDEEDHEALYEASKYRELGISSTYASTLKRADGTLIRVLIMGTPRTHEGRIVGNVAAIIPLGDDLRLISEKEYLTHLIQQHSLKQNATQKAAHADKHLH